MEQQGYMRRIRVCLYEPETQNSLLPLLPVIVSFRPFHYADFSAKGQIVPNQSCFCYVCQHRSILPLKVQTKLCLIAWGNGVFLSQE